MCGSYREVVPTTPAVSLDVEYREEDGDLVSRRSIDGHLTADIDRVVSWPAWTHYTTAGCRQHLVTSYTSHRTDIIHCICWPCHITCDREALRTPLHRSFGQSVMSKQLFEK